ncbi:hypothetical protein NQZ68_027244 [Dissostichus eleginoides]|nr:hypothetical protein NQZ68_027244 [Dissostichus eleginoides]
MQMFHSVTLSSLQSEQASPDPSLITVSFRDAQQPGSFKVEDKRCWQTVFVILHVTRASACVLLQALWFNQQQLVSTAKGGKRARISRIQQAPAEASAVRRLPLHS